MEKPLIQFIDVKKSFGSIHVLKGICLSIFKGEIVAIIGKSGIGKSVLLKHIIGLIKEDSGKILINGIEKLSSYQDKTFKKKLSYMFQDNALFDFLNIFDNIALPLKENSSFPKEQIKSKVEKLMNQLGLEKTKEKFPAQLSGGMRKRAAFARALVVDPEIVLFDEPTTGLDPVRKQDVHSMIKDYQKEFSFTCVIVSHDIPAIFDVAQRVAMLDDGVIKFEGNKEDILKSDNQVLNSFIKGKSS